MIQIRAVGKAEVRVGRTPIKPDSVVLFAVALYLGCTAGEAITRARLLDLFWPEANESDRRHALRQLLYRLRRAGLEFHEDGEGLVVSRENVDSDIDAVLLTQWPEAASSDAVMAAAEVLPGYRPTLPHSFRDWVDEMRGRVAAQYRRATLRLIASARRDGRWHEVDDWGVRCLAQDPLNEEATLARAEAAAMMGSKARAIELLDGYLWELGDRERLIGLPAKVLRRRISEQPRPGISEYAESPPLVGRDSETRRLNGLLARAITGQRSAALIAGVPGIGKTALVRSVVDSAHMRGWHSISTSLQASDASRPLAAFVDLFAVLLQLPGALGCAPSSLTQLQRLTRHGVEEGADVSRSQEAEAVRERIRIAALDLLMAVCEESPLIIVLEDLQWSDAPSQLLLRQLVERTSALPLLWLLTSRPGVRHDELRQAMTEDVVETMRLAPLGAADAEALFRYFVGHARVVDDVVLGEFSSALTGGNPFFIREMARHYADSGGTDSLPHSLRALIQDRIARLPREAQHVLHTCAVLGRYSSVPRVAQVLEIGTAGLLACLEELDAIGILGAGKAADTLALHDLWQEEVLISLRPASRQLIHHRCGAVLEAESARTRSASMVWEAARHFVAAGAPDRALRLLEECARQMLINGLPLDAAQTYGLAYGAAATDEDRYRALSGRIAALHKAARWTDLSELIEPAIVLSERCSGRPHGHSDLELLQTELLWRTEADSNGCLARAMACVEDESASASHRASAGLVAVRAASNLARWAELERAHAIVQALRPATPQDECTALAVDTVFHTEIGSLNEALSAAERWISFEREIGSVRGLTRALRFANYPLRCVGDYDRALLHLQAALALAQEQHLVEDAFAAADAIASTHVERGCAPQAREWLLRAEALAKRIGAPYAEKSLNSEKAILALADNEPHVASMWVDMDLERTIRDPLVRQRLMAVSILVRIFAALGQRQTLENAVEALSADLVLVRRSSRLDYFVASLAVGLASLGKERDAIACVRQYFTTRRDRSQPSTELAAFRR